MGLMNTRIILAGDIGGTKTRLAFFKAEDERLTCLVEQTFDSREHAGLGEIVRGFISAQHVKVDQACFGVAGVVKRGRAVATNLPWVVDSQNLASVLALDSVSLLNDVEANAYGIEVLAPTDFFILNEGEHDSEGNQAVISAGTGLGEAGLCWNGKHHIPFASEGGHSDFAPTDDLQIELLIFLRNKFGHVSWERLLSGPGLYNIYTFFRDTGRGEESAELADELRRSDPAAAITTLALTGKSWLCEQALDLFIMLYGSEAGNQALKLMATGGVFLGGGIAPKIIDRLKSAAFMASFVDKGRMQTLLQAMPVKVILNDKTALLGAAHYTTLQQDLAGHAEMLT
jgi:glucokinase